MRTSTFAQDTTDTSGNAPAALSSLPGLQGLPGLQDLPGILTPHASIGVSVEAHYDSNIARTDAATALVRGLVREDYTTSPHVVVDLASVLAGANVFLQGQAATTTTRTTPSSTASRRTSRAGRPCASAAAPRR